MMLRTVATIVCMCVFGVAACAGEKAQPLQIDSKSVPIATGEDAATSIGKLHHLGSLRLTSPDSNFGGISGLIVSPDGGRFLAITDSSHWLTGKLSYRGNRLTGATGIEIAPLLDANGKPMSGKAGDAEGLTGALDGDVFVSFERNHRIWRYDFGDKGLTATPTPVTTPGDLKNAPDNGGLEGIAQLKDGRLLAITESFYNDSGNLKAWLLDQKKTTAAPLSLRRRMPFNLTDIQQLDNGDVLTLERRFSSTGGVGFSMRRIEAKTIEPGALLDGKVIADAAMNFNIDNMEGLSLRHGENGETLVYLVSDDNFNAPLQQNLLMLFELRP
jgi:hypothetical protein